MPLKRYAGAPSAPSTEAGGRMRRHFLALAYLCILGLAALLGTAAPTALAAAPTATIENASEVSFASAKASGEVDPADHETSYHFEYVSQANFEASEWAEASFAGFGSLAEGAGPTPVSEVLAGLTPSTVYHLRIRASNSEGEEAEAIAASTFETEAVDPPSASGLAVGAATADSAHFEGTVNSGGSGPGERAGTYRFACTPECPGIEDPHEFEAEGFADGSDHAVEADATALQPNTEYTVTLLAQNAGGESNASESFVTETSAPEATTLAITGPVADTAARLLGAVNPHNSALSDCHFEYGLATSYGQSAPCDSAPAGNEAVYVGADLFGLQPSTTYHYRIVADNGTGGPVAGADRTFATAATPAPQGPCPNAAIRKQQGSAYLPDCRAYELVSPPDKGRNFVTAGMQMSSDGNRALFDVFGGVPGAPTGARPPLLATRTPAGWISKSPLPPRAEMVAASYLIVTATPTLSGWIASANDGLSSSTYAPDISLLRLTEDGDQSLLRRFPVAFGANGINAVASNDLSHVFAPASEQIVPSQTPDTSNIYDFGSGTPVLVSRMPGTELAPACGVSDFPFGFAGSASGSVAQRWASTDGSHAFFMTRGDTSCNSAPLQLYVWEGQGTPDSADDVTTRISGPPIGADPDPGASEFIRAAPSGTQAFFRTATSLDPADDTDGSATDQDVYRWTAGVGNACITCAVPGAQPIDAVRQAVVSEDGSHLYFNSAAQLADAPAAGSVDAPNMYVVEDGAVHFIARTNGANLTERTGNNGDLTPDGNVLIIGSTSPFLNAPTGSDNGGREQLYRYDDRDGSLACISCPSVGAASNGVRSLVISNASVPGDVHGVTDDGTRVFFTTGERLVPVDVNDGPDIYEWNDGGVGLITSGRAQYPTRFHFPRVLGVSPDGRDVFFLDIAKFTHDAQDDTFKLYDARVGGGFAPPPTSPAPCGGEACLGSPSPQSGPLGLGSDGFAGPGNAAARQTKARKCAKGRHRVKFGKKARCTRQSKANTNRRVGR